MNKRTIIWICIATILYVTAASVNADMIANIKSIKPSGSSLKSIPYSPFIFEGLIDYEADFYFKGGEKGSVLKYDRKTGQAVPFGGIYKDTKLRTYEFKNEELILNESNIHVFANNDQKYRITKMREDYCYVADEIGGRKDKLLICLYAKP